ncbi:MAG: phosphotransferase, partial [Clostridium sp.]|nr:phosphotransferase [Clostridium sp.]
DDYIKEIERAAELLSFSVYSSYRENSKNIVVCHNDLAEHNFLIKDDDMYLIDFDYCSIDLRIMDLTDLILKGIKNAAFDVDKAVNIIEAYNEVCPLEKEEYKFIYILLSYPRDFYSIVRDYYHKQKDWDEEVFISRLNNKLMNEEFRHEFLVKYKEKYKELFY